MTREGIKYLAVLAGAIIAASNLAAAPLPILVTTYPAQAMAGTRNPAYIFVRLATASGIPNTKAQLPPPTTDTVGGVQLANSNWTFLTLASPPGYGIQFVAPGAAQPTFLAGQVRILSIRPYGNNLDGDATAGLYTLQVAPAAGFRRARKAPIQWVAGEYRFMVSYREGSDQGTAFGELTVR